MDNCNSGMACDFFRIPRVKLYHLGTPRGEQHSCRQTCWNWESQRQTTCRAFRAFKAALNLCKTHIVKFPAKEIPKETCKGHGAGWAHCAQCEYVLNRVLCCGISSVARAWGEKRSTWDWSAQVYAHLDVRIWTAIVDDSPSRTCDKTNTIEYMQFHAVSCAHNYPQQKKWCQSTLFGTAQCISMQCVNPEVACTISAAASWKLGIFRHNFTEHREEASKWMRILDGHKKTKSDITVYYFEPHYTA